MSSRITCLGIIFSALFLPLIAYPEIHILVERTRDRSFDDIHFFLRMPTGWDGEEAEKDVRGRDKYPVRGVLALCSHQAVPEDVKRVLAGKGRFPHFLRWADANRMAVVTWTNFRGYTIHESGDEMTEQNFRDTQISPSVVSRQSLRDGLTGSLLPSFPTNERPCFGGNPWRQRSWHAAVSQTPREANRGFGNPSSG